MPKSGARSLCAICLDDIDMVEIDIYVTQWWFHRVPPRDDHMAEPLSTEEDNE